MGGPSGSLAERNSHRPPRTTAAVVFAATLGYAALLAAFWFAARRFDMQDRIGGHFPSAFASFGLLLLPFWAFGFGLSDSLRRWLRSPRLRIVTPSLLLIPYLLFSLPRGGFRLEIAAAMVSIPVTIAAIYELVPPGKKDERNVGLSWQDIAALLLVGLPVQFGLFRGAWPYPGLGAMPKLLLVDATLYAFLVVRQLEGVGYDFRPHLRDASVGLREFAYFAPIGMAFGLALKFIAFHDYLPVLTSVAAAWLITFFFVAVPEELFFRGILFNLIQRRSGSRSAMIVSSLIFGLSHFNKPLPFNWRYVTMASIAGVFYARAWRSDQRILASSITHTTVDVVWGVWFR
jgi:membrane protease YdiL (CAAX protease family)